MIYKRIIITGDAGRGKSTLAAKLSKKFGIPSHSTDDYFYEVKYSKPRDREQALEQISRTFAQEKWIVEGTTAWLLEPGMTSADIILYLRYKNILSQWCTLLKRGLLRKNEKIKQTLALMKHVFYKQYRLGYKKGKVTHQEFIEPHRHKVVTLSSFKEIENFLRTGLLILLFLFCPVHVFAATTALPIDFVRNQIWFSKQPFSGGEQVKIYTSVFNGSTADARGSVEFYDGKTLLGTTQFSAAAGGSQIVSIRWTASSGSHAFQAKITAIHATYSDGKEESLPDIATGSTVNVTVTAPAPATNSGSGAAANTVTSISASGILRTLDPGPITATSTLSQQLIHGLAVAASSTDALLDRTEASLEVAKLANDRQIALAKAAATPKTPSKASSASLAGAAVAQSATQSGVDLPASPFRILYSYFLHFLTSVLKYKILVYVVVVYLLYKILRFIWGRFSRRGV